MGLELAQANSTNRFQSAWFAAAKGPAYSQARSGKIQHQPFRIVQTQRLASQAAITFHAYDGLVAGAAVADLDFRDDRGRGGGRGVLNRQRRAHADGAVCRRQNSEYQQGNTFHSRPGNWRSSLLRLAHLRP